MVAADSSFSKRGSSSSSRRKKDSALERTNFGLSCIGVYGCDYSILGWQVAQDYSRDSCGDLATLSSACCDFDERGGQDPALEMSCRSNGDCSEVQEACSGGTASCMEKSHPEYTLYASGWMYGNQQGQMCGPYTQQQLYDGLSTGFLPEDLPVYPIINGYMPNSVPLKYFRQFPDHVATGFAYLQTGMISVVPPVSSFIPSSNCTVHQHETQTEDATSAAHLSSHPTLLPQTNLNCSASDQLMLNQEEANSLASFLSLGGEHACWFLLDGDGRNHGPHSVLELYNWQQYGYVQDTAMVRDSKNKFRPISLASLIGVWRVKCDAKCDESVAGVSFISDVSEEISLQLHSGIMKIARRTLLDEIISGVMSDFVKAKKSDEQLMSEPSISGVHVAEPKSSQVLVAEKNILSTNEAGACQSMLNERSDVAVESLEYTKSVGSTENFQISCSAVSRVLHNHCMQVMWNAIFYDPVAACASSWRKNRLWFRSSNISTMGSQCQGSLANSTYRPETHVNFTCRVDSSSCKTGHFGELDLATNAANCCEESPREVTLPGSDGIKNIIANISEHVESELFLSLGTQLTDYIGILIEDGANKAASTARNDKMHEEVLGERKEDINCLPAGLRLSSDSRGSQRLLQKGESSAQFTSGDIIASIFTRTLEISDSPISDEIDNLDIHEPPPPGYEINNEMPTLPFKLRPIRSKECIPKIEEYVAKALCRQKLHEDVMKDWESRFLKGSLKEFLASRHKKNFRSGKADVSKGKHQLSHKETLAPRKLKNFSRNKKLAQSNIHNQTAEKPRKSHVKSSEKVLVKRSKKLSIHSHSQKEAVKVNAPSIDLSVQKPIQQRVRYKKKEVMNFHEEKAGKNALNNVICEKSQDVGLADEYDDELLITRIKRISRNKTKELNEGKIAAKSCEDIATFAEESGETVDCKDHSLDLSNKTLRKGQKAHKSMLKRKHMSDVRVQETKSLNGAARGFTETSGEESDKEDHDFGTGEKVDPQRVSKRPKRDAEKPRQDMSKPIRNSEKHAEGKKLVEKDASNVSQKTHKLGSKKLMRRKKILAEHTTELSPTKDLKMDDVNPRPAALKPIAKLKSKANKKKVLMSLPTSDGCARTSINGWDWHAWSLKASLGERSRARGSSCVHIQNLGSNINLSQNVLSARTNRAKMRNLLAAADGADLLKVSHLKARKKRLRFQQSKIHDWGLVALEPIEAEDFVIEYVGELIRSSISEIRERQYEKMGIGSSYLFRLDDGYVVDATKRGGIARFINHSCEPNCYTKIISVDGKKRIFIYAKRHIDTGEEISYNYKFPLEDDKIPCNCGAQKCRGSLN